MSEGDLTSFPNPSTSVVNVFKRLRVKDECLIYHYCTPNTLLSILENRTVRFGEASRMNDGEELLWAEKQFHIALKRLHDRNDVPSGLPVVSKTVLDRVEAVYRSVSENSRQFLACFSTSGDSLSQWRAYADDAQGFSIGFDSSCVDLPARFYFVEYDAAKQQSFIMKAIAAISEESKKDTYAEYNWDMDIMYLYGASPRSKIRRFWTKEK